VSARPALAWGRAPRLRTPRARPESLHLTCADRRSWSTRAAQSAANIHARGSSEAAEPFYSNPIPTPRPSRPRGAARAAPYPFALRPASTAAACCSRSACRRAAAALWSTGAAGARRVRRLRSTDRAPAPGGGSRRRSGGARCFRTRPWGRRAVWGRSARSATLVLRVKGVRLSAGRG